MTELFENWCGHHDLAPSSCYIGILEHVFARTDGHPGLATLMLDRAGASGIHKQPGRSVAAGCCQEGLPWS